MSYVNQILKAPFDKEQLTALQKRQSNEKTNRYLCPEHSSNDRFYLEAYADGLKCPECGQSQDWAVREIHDDKKKKKIPKGLPSKEPASPAAETKQDKPAT